MSKPTTEAISKSLKTIIRSAGSRFVTVEFIKKNGELRSLTFNPRDFAEIKGDSVTGSSLKPEKTGLFRVRDIRLKAWRSFNADTVISITANGVCLSINKEG